MTTKNAKRFPRISVNQIQEAMRAAGSHWWDADTMRTFGTKVKSAVYNGPGGAYFVTSDFTGFDRNARGYTIRRYDADKQQIHSEGDEIGTIADLEEARAEAARLAFGGDQSAILGVCKTTLTPATPRDDLRAAMKRAGIECTEGTARELMKLAQRVQKAAEDHCNKPNFDPSKMYESARDWLAKTFPGLDAKIGGDPRGATFKLKLPNGETNDFGREGYVVPTSNSLDD